MSEGVGHNRGVSDRHPMLTYTALRVAVFVVPFLLLVLVGADVLTAMLIAAFASGIVSIFLLSRQRDAVSSALATRTDRAKAKQAERTAAEDAWDDAHRAVVDPPADQPEEPGSADSR